uniref:Kelch-like family member 5 n=1 Tax=Eptatretus burgeri TaxID=7764 RepID=A0A8C4NCK5_EPTBU
MVCLFIYYYYYYFLARNSTSGCYLSSAISMELPQLEPQDSSPNCFQAPNHAEQTSQKLERYLKEKLLCDVVLVAGDRRISAHRLMLSAVSDYFEAMFTSNLRESTEYEVTLEKVDPDALSSLVQYVYTGHLQICENNVEALMDVACLLQLQPVVEACSGNLVKYLQPSNCLGIRNFADAHDCLELFTVAHNYTMEHFVGVTKQNEFLLLLVDDVEKFLSSDDVNVPNEETIFEALVAWVSYNPGPRQAHLSNLLSLVRLPLVSPQYLASIESHQLLAHNLECQRLLVQAMKYQLLPGHRDATHSARTHPRKSTVGTMIAVGGMDASKGAISIEQYDLRTNTWSCLDRLSARRLQFGVAVLDDRLYVVGGRDGLKTLNTVECFNPRNRCWSVMPSMSTHRHGLGVVVSEGPMYAVGGHDGWSYLSTVERWDPHSRQWNYVASMSTSRSTLGVGVINGRLYAVGGRDGGSCLRSVECFDPHTNKWLPCSPMLKRRGGVGVATFNGYLYAVGGHDVPATQHNSRFSHCVERYDPKIDCWTSVAPLSVSRDAIGVCLLGDRLYAVGGYNGKSYLTTVEEYDPNSNEWTQITPLCVGRAGACVVTVKRCNPQARRVPAVHIEQSLGQ